MKKTLSILFGLALFAVSAVTVWAEVNSASKAAPAKTVVEKGWEATPTEGSPMNNRGKSGFDDQDLADMPQPFGEVMVFLRPDQSLTASAIVELATLSQLPNMPVTIYMQEKAEAAQSPHSFEPLSFGAPVGDLQTLPELLIYPDVQNQNARMMNLKVQDLPVLLHITGNEHVAKYDLSQSGYAQFVQALQRMGYRGR